MTHWIDTAVFYHIYPLGLCGAPQQNDHQAPPQPRLLELIPWLDHMITLGCNALYLGPVFESSAHGYDTADYYWVDRRLGDHDTLRQLVAEAHRRNIRVVLDGVFNHVGRHFWAFRDVQQHRQNSAYCSWFAGLRFDQSNPYGDGFNYDTWAGFYDLVKSNLHHPDVRRHLLDAVGQWIELYEIDGLRLDAADVLDRDFQRELAGFCRARRADFWLMGEVVHGDYRQWANPGALDSVTNYEAYKGLFSSLNDRNYFEIAYALQRQFGAGGLYAGLPLYNFVDNHDVDRVASRLKQPAQLYPLYALLFTMPGVPSIYYGSEFGLTGKKNGSDAPLRPALDLMQLRGNAPQPDLPAAIQRLAQVRQALPALRVGRYEQIYVGPAQLVFRRQTEHQTVIVALNADAAPVQLEVRLTGLTDGWLKDALNPPDQVRVQCSRAVLELPANWARVMAWEA
ncbi:MAG: cyclomaltodextrinase [Longilinea sp.]|nr:cyclomaltodextrinase [Longilinea sp.]